MYQNFCVFALYRVNTDLKTQKNNSECGEVAMYQKIISIGIQPGCALLDAQRKFLATQNIFVGNSAEIISRKTFRSLNSLGTGSCTE